jgi:hypothetical protein
MDLLTSRNGSRLATRHGPDSRRNWAERLAVKRLTQVNEPHSTSRGPRHSRTVAPEGGRAAIKTNESPKYATDGFIRTMLSRGAQTAPAFRKEEGRRLTAPAFKSRRGRVYPQRTAPMSTTPGSSQ